MANVLILSLCTGKHSDNPMDLDWVLSVFSHRKAMPLPKLQAAAKKIVLL